MMQVNLLIHLMCKKKYIRRFRLPLILGVIGIILCILALMEDWSGRHRYIIPPIPTIVFIIIFIAISNYIYSKANMTVILKEDSIEIVKYGVVRRIPWKDIRNIRIRNEGLDLTFGNMMLSKFFVFDYKGVDVEIPVHRFLDGEKLVEKFTEFYFAA